MTDNVIISNQKEFERIKKSIIDAGAERLHILADFDRTLTMAFVNGQSILSLISILRDGNYLTPDYSQKAHDLYDKYHPIEIDPVIPLIEKKKAMEEWWTVHYNLLIKSGLNKKDIQKAVDSGKIRLRDGFGKFIEVLKTHQIPLVIISSSGLGREAIEMFLSREGRQTDSIHIISNSFEWDKNGNAIGVKQPIIHSLNKDETAIENFPVHKVIQDRKNVLLLGDSLDDIKMIKGFDYENLLKIGFLNEKVKESLDIYKRNYDVVILNDSSLDFVNQLLRELIT